VRQAVKDRWVYPLRPDERRGGVLRVSDARLARDFPWAGYQEPCWRRGRFRADTGGGDYRRWVVERLNGA
jgi:hypothetical protein